MATVEIELRKYKKYRTEVIQGKKVKVELPDAPMPLVLRITSGSKVSRKNTGLYVKATEWDERKRLVNRKHPEFTRLNDALLALTREAEGLKADAIKDGAQPTPSRILAQVFATHDFYVAAEEYGKTLKKYNSSKSYTAMANMLKGFAPTLSGEEVTPEFLEAYRKWLEKKDKQYNTIVTHLRKIRTVLSSMQLKTKDPFQSVKVGTYRRAKNPDITMDDILTIRDYAPRNKGEAVAKETFLFSFYAAGMRSSDVLQLKWSNITEDRIRFDPNKTKDSTSHAMSILLNDVTRSILAGRDRNTKTVFDLLKLTGDGKEAVKERGTIQAKINDSLKAISLHGKIGKPLSFKMARTAFAQIANEVSGRNVYGIQQAMGHSKIATTEIYLGSDNRAVDELLHQVYLS